MDLAFLFILYILVEKTGIMKYLINTFTSLPFFHFEGYTIKLFFFLVLPPSLFLSLLAFYTNYVKSSGCLTQPLMYIICKY